MPMQRINADMKVWDVVQEFPETYGVFRQYGCPDMRKGMFAVSAHFMKVRWAAKAHHIDLDKLLHDLNEVIEQREQGSSSTLH